MLAAHDGTAHAGPVSMLTRIALANPAIAFARKSPSALALASLASALGHCPWPLPTQHVIGTPVSASAHPFARIVCVCPEVICVHQAGWMLSC